MILAAHGDLADIARIDRLERAQHAQLVHGAQHQGDSERQAACERQRADQKPRGPHRFTNASSTAAMAGAAMDNAPIVMMRRGLNAWCRPWR